jgi:SAM-dependent methyltransferase
LIQVQRVVEPEWLDELPADDPRAMASRRDLRRLNWFMNSAGTIARAARVLPKPQRIADLGCGDGELTSRVIAALDWRGTEVLLVDRKSHVSADAQARFRALNCTATPLSLNVFDGLDALGRVDVILANLFLHHLGNDELRALLNGVAQRCGTFVACEPRRSALARAASRCVGALGCNAVTRHDAVASVRAGFANRELSALWPTPSGWSFTECRAGMFSHLFIARRA